jgi:alpha-D-xyloside xylohydrolase
MRRLTALAAVLAITGCGGGAHRSGLSIQIGRDPFRVTVLQNGKAVVSESLDGRLRYQLADSGNQFALTYVMSSHGDAYRVATTEAGRTAAVVVARDAHGVRLSMQLHPAANVQQVYDAFEAHAGDHFLGGGEQGGFVDLRGRIVPVKVSYVCSAVAVPFFASSAGWGLRLASENIAGLAFPGSSGGEGCRFGTAPQCTFPALADRVEVCVQGARLDEELYVGPLPRVLGAYEADAGLPSVPPASELELVKWRDVVSGPADVLDDIARLRAARIPIGWILLDNPWETCIGTLAFDTNRIRDPAVLVRQVHLLGVRFMLWVSPKDICGTYPPSDLVGAPGHKVLALWKPAAARAYEDRLRRAFSIGVDGVKGDRGDEVELGEHQNEYPLLFAQSVLAALPRAKGVIFRAATVGSQRILPGIWGGDQPGDFSGLQTAVRLGQTAAMSGFPTWGSDVGGFSSSPTAEVFARWAQLSTVSPVFEVGGSGANSTPWVLGADAMSALRAAAVLHYELFPYLYGLLERHRPVLRPLGYAFPADEASWQAEFEFMVGPDLLAAPVVGPGTTPRVYLPPGLWIDLYEGKVVKGPANFVRPTPLAQFPLYVRDSAVVPFDLRTPRASWWSVDELTHPGHAGYLVAGDEQFVLRGEPHDVQLFVPAGGKPARVTLAGRDVAWIWQSGPFPGVVVRVHGPTVHGPIVLHGA